LQKPQKKQQNYFKKLNKSSSLSKDFRGNYSSKTVFISSSIFSSLREVAVKIFLKTCTTTNNLSSMFGGTDLAYSQSIDLVAGTNVSISESSGTITINSTDEFTGTVTSVAQTVPTGFTVSGSPITASGTLAIGFDTGYQ